MFEQRDLSFIYKYFIAEKQAGLLFLVAGLAAILLAAACWFFIKSHPAFYKGLAIPLVVLGLLQAIVGFTIYTRTDKQKTEIAYNMGMEPAAYVRQTEMPRMKKVMKNFVLLRWLEIIFMVSGLVLILVFRLNPERSFWYGLGIALTLQAAFMLGADYFAEKRGRVYVEALQKMIAE